MPPVHDSQRHELQSTPPCIAPPPLGCCKARHKIRIAPAACSILTNTAAPVLSSAGHRLDIREASHSCCACSRAVAATQARPVAAMVRGHRTTSRAARSMASSRLSIRGSRGTCSPRRVAPAAQACSSRRSRSRISLQHKVSTHCKHRVERRQVNTKRHNLLTSRMAQSALRSGHFTMHQSD